MNPKPKIENLTRMGKGRPKGALNKCTRAKEDYFKVFFQLGGIKLLKKVLTESKKDRSRFLFDTLPSLMPKKTQVGGDLTGSLTVEIIKFSELRKEDEEKNGGKQGSTPAYLGEKERDCIENCRKKVD